MITLGTLVTQLYHCSQVSRINTNFTPKYCSKNCKLQTACFFPIVEYISLQLPVLFIEYIDTKVPVFREGSHTTEPEFVIFLRSPAIDSQTGGPVRQPYLTYRLARLYTVKKRIANLPSPAGMSVSLPNSPWAGIMTS